MARSLARQGLAAVVAVAAVAAGMWAVGAGWTLNEVRMAAAERPTATVGGEVVGRDRVGGVDLDVVRYDDGRFAREARLLPPVERPAVGDTVEVRVPSETAPKPPGRPDGVDYARGASSQDLAALGRRASLLLVSGFAVAVLGAFAAAAVLHLAWPEVKRQTTPHANRQGA